MILRSAGVGTLSLTLMATLLVSVPGSPPRAENAKSCIIVRDRNGGGQELFNLCAEEVEVAWCVYGTRTCMKFTDRWTFGARDSHPIEAGPVIYDACRGANSIKRNTGTSLECE